MKQRKKITFNIIDHFSKFGISYLINNKESKTILKFLEITLECYGIPDEIGSDKGIEFKNHLIESFWKDNEIKFINGNPYNPHSQGMVERYHQTIKDMLYCNYIENKDKIHLKDMLGIVVKKYNNIKHSATKYKPNEIFFSH